MMHYCALKRNINEVGADAHAVTFRRRLVDCKSSDWSDPLLGLQAGNVHNVELGPTVRVPSS